MCIYHINKKKHPMKKHLIPIFSLFLLTHTACENDSNDYPIEYTSHEIVVNNIKVYTKDGDISDNPAGKDFIERHKNDLDQFDDKIYEGKITANYTSSSSVELTFENKTETRKVHQDAELIYWEAKEISTVPSSKNPFVLHKPLYNIESDLPASAGFTKKTEFKHCFYLKSDNDKLKFPIINIIYKYNNGYVYYSGLNNEFNKEVLTDFTATDTILVNQAWLELY